MKKLALHLAITFFAIGTTFAQNPIPRIIEKDGRHALLVDGKPYFILGGQAHNSSGWPGMLSIADSVSGSPQTVTLSGTGQDFTANLNPKSLEVIPQAKVEPSLANAVAGTRYQFERLGYFCVDPDSKPGKLVFNRTVALKDTWAKVEKKQGTKS